jgi:hypothetical protein
VHELCFGERAVAVEVICLEQLLERSELLGADLAVIVLVEGKDLAAWWWVR